MTFTCVALLWLASLFAIAFQNVQCRPSHLDARNETAPQLSEEVDTLSFDHNIGRGCLKLARDHGNAKIFKISASPTGSATTVSKPEALGNIEIHFVWQMNHWSIRSAERWGDWGSPFMVQRGDFRTAWFNSLEIRVPVADAIRTASFSRFFPTRLKEISIVPLSSYGVFEQGDPLYRIEFSRATVVIDAVSGKRVTPTPNPETS